MRRLLAVALAAVVSMGITAGCAGSDDESGGGTPPVEETGTPVGSCDHGGGVCTDMYAADGVDTTGVYDEIAAGCSGRGWTPSETACPTANRVGTCKNTVEVAGVSLQSRDRIYSTYSGGTMSTECTSRGGQWVAD